MFVRKPFSLVTALLGVTILGFLLSACQPNAPQSTFGYSGEIAKDQLRLLYLIFGIAAFVFVVVEGLLVYIIVKFRRKPTDVGLPPQIHGNTRLEIAWTIAPVILLAVVAVPTYQNISKENAVPAGMPVVHVTVNANQWWWEFRYPDLGIVTANELHVPLNAGIDVQLRSRDVIHSFWIPKLAGTTDVVPSRENHMWFSASEAGDYYGQCKEFCGVDHALMKFRVIAEDQATFDAWVAKQKGTPVAPADALAQQGAQLFQTKGCVVCHTINGPDTEATQQARAAGFQSGAALFSAPNLTTFGDRLTMAGGTVDKNAQNVAKWVNNPNDIKPGNHMAELAGAYKTPTGNIDATPAELNALVTYLMGRTTDPSKPLTSATPVATAAPSGGTGAPSGGTGAVSGGQVNIATVGNNLQFDTDKITVHAGAQTTVTLKNSAGSAALQHNWVLVKKGTEDAVGAAGTSAGPASNWVPVSDPNVLAYVKLVNGGSSGSTTFTAPAVGTYAFICSFPGHTGTMRGTFEVVP